MSGCAGNSVAMCAVFPLHPMIMIMIIMVMRLMITVLWFTNITVHKNKHVIIMSSIQATSPSESVQVGTTPVKTEGLDACTKDTKNNMQIHVKSMYI